MFCSHCGKKIPDDSSFCAHCGSKLNIFVTEISGKEPVTPSSLDSTQLSSTVSLPQNHQDTPSVKENKQIANVPIAESRKQCFLTGWRSFITSPLVLITIIVHSVSVMFSLAGIGDTTEAMEDLSYLLGDFAGSLLSLFSVGTVLVNILLTIGMWMVYANGQKKDDTPPSTNGLSLLTAFVNIYYIGTPVIFAIMGLICLGTAKNFSGFVIFLIMGAGAVAGAIIRGAVITILENTEDALVRGNVNYEKIGGIGIFSIISGGITAVSLITQLESLEFTSIFPTLTSSAFSILIGCVMLSYRGVLEGIQYEQNKLSKTK